MTDELHLLRNRFGHLLVLILWGHVPLLGIVALLTGTMSVVAAAAIGAAIAIIYQVTWYRNGPAPATRHIAAVLLIAQPASLLILLRGHPWQMDMHMYFFPMIALNIAWFDRSALLLAAVVTAVHHLVFLYFLPLAVFSTEGNLLRVGLHAAIVIFQTMVLVWLSDKVAGSFMRIGRMSAELFAKSETLNVRTQEAEQANRAKGMFLANMSHEIRTPINAVLGFCHLIQRSALDPQQRDQIAKINSAGVTLLRLVNDILDLSKGEAGQLTLEDVVFDPRAELSRQVQILSEALHKKNLRIEMQIDPRIPVLLAGDVTRLTQMLNNLLGNAIKFTSEGTIAIDVRLAEDRGDTAVIETSIRDSGIGMTSEQLSRMFMPFMQADSSTTRRFGGTGLGLAICRQIVEQMGGSIRAESEPGRGSTFTMLTPLRVPRQQILPQAMPSEQLKRLRILLVDDNPIARQIVTELFTRWDMTIDTADAGSVALAMVKREQDANRPYDLVILDWKMPGMDGLDTLRAIRSVLGSDRVPLTMMMTSYDIDEVRQDADDIGINQVVSKPINPHSLLDALHRLPLTHKAEERHSQPYLRPILPQNLQGLRVLLVEDNDINREIASEILTDVGLVVECAANGAIACRMIEETSANYAAVLMDIQMPEMDGITATRRIRKTWSSERLPIIAMTAHAFAEERQRCMDAGMDDHLTKPIDIARLLASLERWLRPASRILRMPVVEADAFPVTLPPFDVRAALQRVNGKEALLRRLILSFADTYASTCDDLADMIRDDRADDAHRLAHSLKGVSASLELPQVAMLAGRVEQALTACGSQDVSGLLAELRSPLEHAVSAARTLRPVMAIGGDEHCPTARAADLDPVVLADAVETVREQIRRRSLSARQSFARLADLLQLDGAARQAHPLYMALQRLDYSSALAVMNRDFPGQTPRASA